jgi:hypothetical protein
MTEQAHKLLAFGAGTVLIKGGHGGGAESVDLLVEASGETLRLAAPRIATENTHGSGCTFASAIAAGLAKGLPLPAAAREAKAYVSAAIAAADRLEVISGHDPLHHFRHGGSFRGARKVATANLIAALRGRLAGKLTMLSSSSTAQRRRRCSPPAGFRCGYEMVNTPTSSLPSTTAPSLSAFICQGPQQGAGPQVAVPRRRLASRQQAILSPIGACSGARAGCAVSRSITGYRKTGVSPPSRCEAAVQFSRAKAGDYDLDPSASGSSAIPPARISLRWWRSPAISSTQRTATTNARSDQCQSVIGFYGVYFDMRAMAALIYLPNDKIVEIPRRLAMRRRVFQTRRHRYATNDPATPLVSAHPRHRRHRRFRDAVGRLLTALTQSGFFVRRIAFGRKGISGRPIRSRASPRYSAMSIHV